MSITQVQRSFIADRTSLMTDMWRLTTNLTTSDQEPINANLERVDDHGGLTGAATAGLTNPGMTQSSGIFTFPSTGKYYIRFQINCFSTNTPRYIGAFIQLTTDNSSYTTISTAYINLDDADTSSSSWTATSLDGYVDITNTTTHKVSFFVNAAANVTFYGSDSRNYNYMEFVRVGDT